MMKFKLNSEVLAATMKATTVKALNEILEALPINPEYVYDRWNPQNGWIAGKLHFVPVGLEPGNAGRIKLGSEPDNRIAERVVNMLEAHLELERCRELKRDPGAAVPSSPREAVQRYFHLPRLDQIPELNDNKATWKQARDLARRTRVRVVGTRTERAVIFEDEGIGQPPSRLHSTILSLGGDNKIKEPYLIGMWGQGGSSALAASQATWVVSRRAPELGDSEDGFAWTVIRMIHPPGSGRRGYYGYLAASPTGEVPYIAATLATTVGFGHGTRIGHLGFDLGTMDPTKLYQALNHVLANPILPFEIFRHSDTFSGCIGWPKARRSPGKDSRSANRLGAGPA
jgi:hypothetical protein